MLGPIRFHDIEMIILKPGYNGFQILEQFFSQLESILETSTDEDFRTLFQKAVL